MKISKKTICISMVIIIATASIAAGCSSKSVSAEVPTGEQIPTSQREKGNQQGGGSRPERGTSPNSGSFEGMSGKNTQGSTASGSSASGQTQILGKVTSIVGNEVVLAIGTQSSDKSSSALTLTGENKTILIPVGLSLSGTASGAVSGLSGTKTTGTKTTGSLAAGTRATGSKSAGTAGQAGTTKVTAGVTTGAAAGSTTATKRASDFSSITAGMVLRITQQTIDGTESVVKVAVVSK